MYQKKNSLAKQHRGCWEAFMSKPASAISRIIFAASISPRHHQIRSALDEIDADARDFLAGRGLSASTSLNPTIARYSSDLRDCACMALEK
jgi:hypothetical protein